MPRRRGGKEFKNRQARAIANGKSAQKRGNNKLLINTLLAEATKKLIHMPSRNIQVVSNVPFKHPVFIVDPKGPLLLRLVGSPDFMRHLQSASEASTEINYQPEVIAIE